MTAAAELTILLRVVKTKRRAGAPRSFGLGHVFLALYIIHDSVRLSRDKLGILLGLGGGAVKSLISKLRGSSLVRTLKSGNVLSDKGLKVVNGLRQSVPVVSEVVVRSISTGKKNVAAVLRGVDRRSLDPVAIRDDVIRAGGSGATTLLFDGSSICVPNVYDDLASVSTLDATALSRLDLRKGDVVLVAGGNSLQIASVACATAVVHFLSRCL